MNPIIPDHIQHLIGLEGYQWLAAQAAQMDSVVEVGCWHGAGTYALCTACPGTVYAVDHWRGSPAKGDATYGADHDTIFAKFQANVGHFPNLRILAMPSHEAAKQFAPRSVDMVVIDAGHDKESVDLDFAVWFPICRKLFCGHDWGHVPVRAAVEALGRPVTHHPADIWSVEP